MDVQLTPNQIAFARDAIKAGRLQHEEEVVQEALALWESRERTRSGLLASLASAEASFAEGKGRTITQQSMHALAEEVKQRGRARLDAERSSRAESA